MMELVQNKIKNLRVALLLFVLLGTSVTSAQLMPSTSFRGRKNWYGSLLSAGNLKFKRPIDNGTSTPTGTNGTPLPFQVRSMKVSTTGNYEIMANSEDDGYLALYSSSFDLTNPLTNVMLANDDYTDILYSRLPNVPLTANQTYYIVESTYGLNTDFNYTVSVRGPSTPQYTSPLVTKMTLNPSSGVPTSATLKGIAPFNSTAVKIFKDSSCTQKVSSVNETPAQFQGAGISASLDSNMIEVLYSQALDANSNPLPCVPVARVNTCTGTFSVSGLSVTAPHSRMLTAPAASWNAITDNCFPTPNYYFSIGTAAGDADVLNWVGTTNTSESGNMAMFSTPGTYSFDLYALSSEGDETAKISSSFTVSFPNLSSFTGSFSAASPQFQRTQANNTMAPTTLNAATSFRYSVQKFQVSTTGTYEILNSFDVDGFMILYQNSFSSSSPLSNAVIANDDWSGNNTSAFQSVNLTAGVDYYIVSTVYNPAVTAGNFNVKINGPGTVTLY